MKRCSAESGLLGGEWNGEVGMSMISGSAMDGSMLIIGWTIDGSIV